VTSKLEGGIQRGQAEQTNVYSTTIAVGSTSTSESLVLDDSLLAGIVAFLGRA
jgi:hypothetical protein